LRFAAHIIQSKQAHALLQLQLASPSSGPTRTSSFYCLVEWTSGAWVSSSNSCRNPLPTIHHLSPSTVSRRASSSSCRTQSKIEHGSGDLVHHVLARNTENNIHKVRTNHHTTRAVNSVSSSMASTTAGSSIKSCENIHS